ncbi:hypothetical protein K440DRAFT_661584 [Wilcoxina mikolae CBS 423.85]|nr:hypothetical protein K440DRAFT_661584 [Wilcoxina mikolae CBS 423.85]
MNHILSTRVRVFIFLLLLCLPTVSGQNVISDLSGISGALSAMIAALFIASRLTSNIYVVSVRQMAASLLSSNPRLGFLVPQRDARHSEYITDIELTTAGVGQIYDDTPDIALIRTRDVLRINRRGWMQIDNTQEALSKCISNYLPQTRAALISHPEKMLFFKRCAFPRSFKPMFNFELGYLPHVRSSIVVLEWLMTAAQKDLDSVVAELVQKYNSAMDSNDWNDNVVKALEDLERLTSGQVRCNKIARNYTYENNFNHYKTQQHIEIRDWGTSDSNASLCTSFFPLVIGYCAALACPELAFSSMECLNHPETTCTPLSTEPSPAPKQDNTSPKHPDIIQTSSRSDDISPKEDDNLHPCPPGTVTGLVTLLMYATHLPDADSDPLSVVISSFNGPERIDFSNEPNKLPAVMLDFIRKRAVTGGPITECAFGNLLVNIFELLVRLGLIALACTGANITPLAALLTADIFGLKRGRYDFRPGEYRTQGLGVRNTEFSVTWHVSKHTHIIASKGIASVRSSAVIASYGVAWLCWFFRDTTRAWLGLQSTPVSPPWLKSCGLVLILAGAIALVPMVGYFYFGMQSLYRHGDLHIQRGQHRRLSFFLCFRILGPILGVSCIVVSTLICPALYLWNVGLRTRGMEIAIRAVVDVAGIVGIMFTETGVFRILNASHVVVGQLAWWSTWFMIMGTVPFTKEG